MGLTWIGMDLVDLVWIWMDFSGFGVDKNRF